MAVLLRNPSVEICALPFPLKGLLKGGQDVIINCTYAALIAACPSITNLHVENLGDSYAGHTDTGTYDLVTASTAEGDSTIDGALSVGTTLTVVGDVTAAGGFRQCIQFGKANVAVGDVIDIRIRTGSGWSATTADLGVALEVEC